MSNENNVYKILEIIHQMFPNAHCELNYHNVYELTVAVMLSAQTTDKAVNEVTVGLFQHYPTLQSLAEAKINDVEQDIKRIGLYHNKAINIIKMAQEVIEKHHGEIPSNFNDLIKLPGIGQKTANVILVEYFKIPRFPVDTHVDRVCKRLGFVEDDKNVNDVENKMMTLINKKDYHLAHHLFLFWGRYHCLSRNPKCDNCPLIQYCIYKTKKP